MNVAVIGASDNREKYSYRAVKLLSENGHRVFPVHPAIKEIDDLPVYAAVSDIRDPLDTVTLYVSAAVSSKMTEAILEARPKRIIFNPGAENPELESRAAEKGIMTLEACTLVLLTTGQFNKA